jgi:hypothetical protein
VAGVFVKKSGNGDITTFASAFRCLSSPAMMGAAKVAGGFADLHGYSKQGMMYVKCVAVLAFTDDSTFKDDSTFTDEST